MNGVSGEGRGRLRLSRRGRRWRMVCAGLLILLFGWFAWFFWSHRAPEGVYLDHVGEVPIVTDLLSEDYAGRTATKRHIRYIVIHETGNPRAGADAAAHNEYLHSEPQKNVKLSWHYTVDERVIYHHLPDDEIAWHAGDRVSDKGGNACGIGVEICVNRDGDYAQALDNAAQLTAALLEAYGLELDDVKQHYDFSGKNCPENLRRNDGWQNFLTVVEQYGQAG